MPLVPAISFFPKTGNGFIDALPYLGGALVVLALFALLRSRRRRMASGGAPSAREQLERYRQEKSVRGDLESLMVEIEQLAKRMSAQLDAKAVQLERAIREADERLARLERATNAPLPAPPVPSAPPGAAPTPTIAGASAPPVDPLMRSVHELADQGLPPVEIARRLDEHVGKVELILALRNA